jgi:two-component system chemotaxis response regulator CheB
MPKIRVLVVDDAVVMRRLISGVLESDPDLELAGVAANGKLALAKIPQVNPDIVTLDVEMPEMNGIETVEEIRKLYPKLPVIMFSTMTQRGAVATLDALARGATDYVTKPANIGSVSEGITRLESELIPKIKAYTRGRSLPASAPIAKTPAVAQAPAASAKCNILAIGSSTGGPNALHEIIPALPSDLPVPVVIVQHMPAVFTDLLATRLNEVSKLRVHEAKQAQAIERGNVYIAPGGKHMAVYADNGTLRARLNEDPPENSCRPAVDVLFRSVAKVCGAGTVGAVLTGMGQDGMRGAQWIREAGGRVLAQDRESSVVWGMPGAVAEAGLADEIVPLSKVAAALVRRAKGNECR